MIEEAIGNAWISRKEVEFLDTVNPRIPYFYSLPKIHKVLLNIEREKCDVLVILGSRDPHGNGMWNAGIAERTVEGEYDGWGDYE
ncbi:hypothetical protein NDU88_007087 [Pleurodeles waltl]|uniref:Uncharacterized protein n=1 Tax=Pleurodeles waltl TaxID=8319 RepID=A0AAV7NVB9_PLEWA|nr:hypothetical protein NDU88_007087 [Pleurodeles waltl]